MITVVKVGAVDGMQEDCAYTGEIRGWYKYRGACQDRPGLGRGYPEPVIGIESKQRRPRAQTADVLIIGTYRQLEIVAGVEIGQAGRSFAGITRVVAVEAVALDGLPGDA